MPPGDRTVVRFLEPTIVHCPRNRFIDVGNQAIGDSNAGEQAQIALGNREGKIHLPGITPPRDHDTTAQQQPVRSTPRTEGPQDFVVRRWLEEARLDMRAQIARPWGFVRYGIAFCFVQLGHGVSFRHPSGVLHRGVPPRDDLPGYHSVLKARIVLRDSPVADSTAGWAWYRETHVARLERDVKRAALLVSPLFQAMKPLELDEILKFASERRYRRGQMILQRGDDGSSMMAVLRGRVRISFFSGEGKEVTLNVVNPGEIFGEMALLDGQPRSADATAIEETLLLVVERGQFMRFLRQNDDLYLRLLAVLCERLRQTSMALEDLALFDLPVRLARVLLKLAEDYGRPIPVALASISSCRSVISAIWSLQPARA